MTAWATPASLAAMVGPGVDVDPDDPWTLTVCAAANAAAFRKRAEAGYVDDPAAGAAAPSADVGLGATVWAAALWRERASTDSYQSFEDLSAFTPTGGAWGTIKRLLGIGRAQCDATAAPAGGALAVLRRARPGWGW